MKISANILSMLAMFALGFWLGYRPKEEPKVIERTDTIVQCIPIERIVYQQVVRRDTIFVPQVTIIDSTSEEDARPREDSVGVVIPIERKVYEDSTFRAVISGYKPTLDSMTIYQRERIIQKPCVAQKSRFQFVAGLQTGYGFTPKGWQPYMGVGVTFGLTFGNKQQK